MYIIQYYIISTLNQSSTSAERIEARLSAAGNLVAAFHSEACVMGEPLFKCGDRAEGPEGGVDEVWLLSVVTKSWGYHVFHGVSPN